MLGGLKVSLRACGERLKRGSWHPRGWPVGHSTARIILSSHVPAVIMNGEITVVYPSALTRSALIELTKPLREMLQCYPASARILSSFPEELFVDNKPPDLFECRICFDTANDPMMCGNQHTCCRRCMSKWVSANQSCPTCKCAVTVDALLKNRTAADFIGQCKVRCLTAIPEEGAPAAKKRKTAKKNTCEWVGTTESLDSHMQECEYVYIACKHAKDIVGRVPCEWTGLRSSQAEHAAVCEYRKEACSYCNTDVQVCNMEEHKTSICTQRPVTCRNVGCAVSYAVADRAQHRAVCPWGITTCPYSATLGCAFACSRNSMAAHAGDASAHFAGLMGALQAAQQTVAQLQEENAEIKRELQRVDSNTHWTHGLLTIHISPTNTTFASYVGVPLEQMIGGMKWMQRIMVYGGNVWAILDLIEGKKCPFEITYSLASRWPEEGDGTERPLRISKTLKGKMGNEQVQGKWRKGVMLNTVSHVDRWHKAGYQLTLFGTLKFKIDS
jgi:hypothetical protein